MIKFIMKPYMYSDQASWHDVLEHIFHIFPTAAENSQTGHCASWDPGGPQNAYISVKQAAVAEHLFLKMIWR